ncbi:MAG: phosphorylase family protein [Acidobacteriaceae bacterium]
MKARKAMIAALPREIASLVHGWQLDEELLAKKIFVYWNDDAIVACAGMGTARAALAVEAALSKGPVRELISIGWAGGLHSAVKAGQVYAPKTIVDATTGERFTASTGEGVLVTARSFANAAEKQRLRATYQAELVDMEAAVVARLAQAHQLPFRAWKAVSDDSSFEFPELARFNTADGWFRETAFAMYLIPRPHVWGKVMRMARNSKLAADNLCKELQKQF